MEVGWHTEVSSYVVYIFKEFDSLLSSDWLVPVCIWHTFDKDTCLTVFNRQQILISCELSLKDTATWKEKTHTPL